MRIDWETAKRDFKMMPLLNLSIKMKKPKYFGSGPFKDWIELITLLDSDEEIGARRFVVIRGKKKDFMPGGHTSDYTDMEIWKESPYSGTIGQYLTFGWMGASWFKGNPTNLILREYWTMAMFQQRHIQKGLQGSEYKALQVKDHWETGIEATNFYCPIFSEFFTGQLCELDWDYLKNEDGEDWEEEEVKNFSKPRNIRMYLFKRELREQEKKVERMEFEEQNLGGIYLWDL